MNKMDRMLRLHQSGMNILDYVENPYTKYGKGDYTTFLHQVFYGYEKIVLMESDGKNFVEHKPIKLDSALLSIKLLEENGNKVVWVVEEIDTERTGTIRININGTGAIYGGSYKPPIRFANFDKIEPIKDRVVVRSVFNFLETFPGQDELLIDFAWTKFFCGKLNERVIFFDYLLVSPL